MRKIIVIAIINLIMSVPAFGGLTWERKLAEIASEPEDQEVLAEFSFKNEGKDAITITAIRSGCGCTTASLDKKTYEPGEEGVISVKVKLEKGSHEVRKSLMVRTNVKSEPATVLTVQVK